MSMVIEAKNLKVIRTRRQCPSGNVSGEDANNNSVKKPEDEALSHRYWAVRPNSEQHDRAFFHPFSEIM